MRHSRSPSQPSQAMAERCLKRSTAHGDTSYVAGLKARCCPCCPQVPVPCMDDSQPCWDIGIHCGSYAGAVVGSASWTYE